MRVIDYLFYFFPQKKSKPPLTRKEKADPCTFFIRAMPFFFRRLNEKTSATGSASLKATSRLIFNSNLVRGLRL